LTLSQTTLYTAWPSLLVLLPWFLIQVARVRRRKGRTAFHFKAHTSTRLTSETVTVTDTLPAGLTATAIAGAGWSCVVATLNCMRNDSLVADSSYFSSDARGGDEAN
jgi:hypothetical protein